VEVPQLALNVLASWRKQTLYAADDDFVFASYTLQGKQPRSGSVLVRDNIRPATIRAGILIEQDGGLYSKDGEVVSRFGFHNLGRHSLATFLMDEQENPAVVQAVLRHSKMDMTLYYSHSSKKAKRAAVENYAKKIAPEAVRVQVRVQESQAVN
jgi:integrase